MQEALRSSSQTNMSLRYFIKDVIIAKSQAIVDKNYEQRRQKISQN